MYYYYYYVLFKVPMSLQISVTEFILNLKYMQFEGAERYFCFRLFEYFLRVKVTNKF